MVSPANSAAARPAGMNPAGSSARVANPAPAGQPTVPNRPASQPPSQDIGDAIAKLPSYVRSLLKVEVPVRVTLAATKLSLQRILDLSPGVILQFNKSCDEPLTLEVGEQVVALGEAVKVGDRFGLSIKSISMPAERFWVVGKQSTAVRAK
jgi:flagellar motor switch/type III secretory pathway protein FliN